MLKLDIYYSFRTFLKIQIQQMLTCGRVSGKVKPFETLLQMNNYLQFNA